MYRQNDELAINGGKQVRTRLFAPWPLYEADEIAAASAVLRSGKVNYWTGNQGQLFEKEFAAATKNKHAIAVANGTVALELALYALRQNSADPVDRQLKGFFRPDEPVEAIGNADDFPLVFEDGSHGSGAN